MKGKNFKYIFIQTILRTEVTIKTNTTGEYEDDMVK